VRVVRAISTLAGLTLAALARAMTPHSPADLKNPCDYGRIDEASEPEPDGNFWEAEYRPTENIDDIPLAPTD
jgi:hypothetical protein